MRIMRCLVGFTVATCLLAEPARGQQLTPQPPTVPPYVDEQAGMGLETAIARALDREPSLRARRADINVAVGQRQQAALRRNPIVSFERREEPGGTDSLTTLGVEWPLELFRRRGRVEVASRELVAIRLGVSDRERVLAADVRMQYGIAAAAVREYAVADEVVATTQRQWEVVRARVETGGAPPLERDLLEVEWRRYEADRLAAAGRADAAIARLKQLIGMPPDAPLLLRQTLETLLAGSPAGELSTSRPVERPDVLEARAQVQVADARIDHARREGRYDVSLFGSYMRMDAGFPQRGFDSAGGLERVRGRFTYLAGGVMVTVPLFNRNQGLVATAQAERSRADALREAAELAAQSDVVSARARDARAQQVVKLYADTIRGLARRNLDVVRQTFDLGRGTVFDVLTEQRRYLEIEHDYTRALGEAWEARVALKRALGEAP